MSQRLGLSVVFHAVCFLVIGAFSCCIAQTKSSKGATKKSFTKEQSSQDKKEPQVHNVSKESNDDQKSEKDKQPKKGYLNYHPEDSEFKFGVRLRIPEFFYGKNLRLLNDDNPTDRVLYFRHTIDFNLEYKYGRPAKFYDLVYVKMTIRNKGVWGDPESIASTTFSPIKEVGAVFGGHKHGIPRHVLWIREFWVQFSVNDVFGLSFCNNHTLTIGSFPFELGRGIALGTAFAVDASDLGFFSEASIDQYAFGARLGGELIKNSLSYDLYGAILNNKASLFNYTNTKIKGQQYFHRNDQARGFGVINYLVAARLRWRPCLRFENAVSRVEPYILYNHNPEQQVEFSGDAKSDLVTLGIASESEFGNFEWGFDTAYNFGNQTVFGWDRNSVKLRNRSGSVVVTNSRVRQAPPGEQPNARKSPHALVVPENQEIINRSPQTQIENGRVIGINRMGTLINDKDRFSDRFVNKYRGSMFVFDMGYTICKPDFKVCAGFGYASGDANPNRDEEFGGDSDQDQEYEGFIGLQEVYSGTRVKSAFLLSGSGKIPRPLTFPSKEVLDPFASTVSRFTNLVFVGTSSYWRPSWSIKKWSFNPNILAFWTDFESPFFDAKTLQNSTSRFARNFLGTELNIFIEAELLPDLRFFTIGALFIPGNHYRDIKGRPLNRAQQAFLDNLDRTGIINDRVPLLGDDKSYFCNLGFEYRF